MNQKLIEKYWDTNLHEDWHECTIEDFKERMTGIGIEVGAVLFSGFSSQGDGACFEGRVVDWNLFLGEHGYPNDVLAAHANYAWRFSVKHRGHYNHENCTEFTFDLPHPDNKWANDTDFIRDHYPGKDKKGFAALAWLAVIRSTIDSGVEDEFTEVFKSYMRQLYRDLEREYYYLTSTEAVWEAIVANELDIEEKAA
jgi:hypothetical protein